MIIPAATSGDVFAVTIKTPNNQVLSSSTTAQNLSTPILALTSSPSISAGSISVNFNQSTLQTSNPIFVEIFSVYNPSEVKNGTVSTPASGIVNVAVSLSGGKYGFRFYFTSYGWSTCSSTISVTIAAPTIPTTVSSYKGGELVITGSSLSKSGTLKINGVKTPIINVTSSSGIAIIPPFVTT